MSLQRAAHSLIRGLAYAVAHYECVQQLNAIAKATLWRLVPYQPVPYEKLRKSSVSERLTGKGYSLLARCIPEHYLEQGRKLAWLEGRQPHET